MPILYPAPSWQPPLSEYVILWHGCTGNDAKSIETNGIDLNHCRVDSDFGRGFYTTTLERQARHWAWKRFYDTTPPVTGNQPVILRFRVSRERLSSLSFLAFVSGDFANEDFWGLVQHCRQSTHASIHNHARPHLEWYDTVSGPVAAAWKQRAALEGADQIGFHTAAAVKLLTDLVKSGNRDDYCWFPVP